MARKVEELGPEHRVFGTEDGRLIELPKMPTQAEMKAQKLFHVALLHHPDSDCVFYDPYEEWYGNPEPRFMDVTELTLKEYQKLAKVYGGEVIGSGWFPRHVSSQTRPGGTKGLTGAMSKCERAIDDLLAVLITM